MDTFELRMWLIAGFLAGNDMDIDFLTGLTKAAGIGGLTIGVFLLIFRDVIRRNVFSSLTKQQSFSIFRLILWLTWSIAVLGLASWVYINFNRPNSQEGRLTIGSVIYSPQNIAEKYVYVSLNNNASKNIVVRKITFSRGKSSFMEEMNNICGPEAGPTRYSLAQFSANTEGESGVIGHLPFSDETLPSDDFVARVSFSNGCAYPTEIQVDLPTQLVVMSRTTVGVRIGRLESVGISEDRLKIVNEDVATLDTDAPPDQVCVFVHTDIADTLGDCRHEKVLHDQGQWFM